MTEKEWFNQGVDILTCTYIFWIINVIKDTVNTKGLFGFFLTKILFYTFHFICLQYLVFLQNILVATSSSGLNVIALFQVCTKMEVVVITKFPLTSEKKIQNPLTWNTLIQTQNKKY